MTKPIARDPMYRRRSFDADIIELCVRWYITYRLSYRDLVAMMAERGVEVSHTTIPRWVVRYVPEFAKRWNRYARRIGSSWRVDETYISIRGKWHYLYRAVDKQGKTVDFLLRRDRGIAAALRVDEGIQVGRKCRNHDRRYRAGASNSQATVLVRSRPPASELVVEAAMAAGAGVGCVSQVQTSIALSDRRCTGTCDRRPALTH
jgi:hypothetical protein